MKKLFLAILFLLLASEADATRYWVATTGSDANACSAVDGDADPGTYKLTIASGLTCLTSGAGDTLTVKAGTYTGVITTNPMVSGASANSPTILECEGVRTCTIAPTSGTNVFLFNIARSYLTIRNFIIDVVGLGTGGERAGIRFSNSYAFPSLIIEHNEIKNMNGPGLVPADGVTDCIIRYNKIHDSTGGLGQSPTGIYHRGINCVIEHNDIYNFAGQAISNYSTSSSASGNVIRYNNLHATGTEPTETDDRVLNLSEANVVVHSNVIYGGTDYGIRLTAGATNAQIYNNTVYNNARGGIRIDSTVSGAVLANNLVIGNGSFQIQDNNGTNTLTTNVTTGLATDLMIDPANADFSLKESSAAIDAGTVIAASGNWPGSSGRYVGAGVDQGALESCVRSGTVVENATPTIVSISHDCPSQSTRDGVGLKTPTVGNYGIVVAGVGATENSAAISGTNRVDITLAVAVTTGQSLTDAMTRSAAPTLTDNVAIGDPNGTLGTNYFNSKVRTYPATAGTNNVGGAGGVVITSVHYRCRDWYANTTGTATTDFRRAEDADNQTLACPIAVGGYGAVVVAIEGSGANPDISGYEWHQNRNAGAYTAMTNTPTSLLLGFANRSAPGMADGASIAAALITSPGSYVAGKVVASQATQPTVDLAQNSTFNAIILVKSDATQTVGDIYCVQAALAGQAVSSITQTKFPCFKIVYPSAGY